jgi:DNA-binding GntR family transcriptional regulator
MDIYDIRAALEEMAARLAVPRMTEATLAQLDSLVEQMDSHLGELVALVKLNHNFHVAFYNVSGRKHLCEITEMLRHRTQHYLHAFITHLGGMPQAQAEHRAILEACRQGDVEQTGKIIHHHVAQVGHAIVEYVRQRDETENSTLKE